MGLFNLANRVASKKLDDLAREHAHQTGRVDTGLPFGARVGGLIQLVLADFALLEGSLLYTPSAAQQAIVAASRLHIDADEDLSIYRLYTSTGVDRDGQGAFLQIMTGKDRPQDIRDLAYYQFLFREYPTTPEEQDAYLGNGYGLGADHYDMDSDELGMISHVAKRDGRAQALLAGAEAIGFDRDAAGGDYIRPWRASERRIDDALGAKGVEKTLSFMQYVRELPAGLAQSTTGAHGPIERLWVAFEHVTSMDGRPASAAWVDYFAGVAIDPAHLKVF